jgi:hypothetical protein
MAGRRRGSLLLAPLAAVAIVAAGCGVNSSSTTGSTAGQTVQQPTSTAPSTKPQKSYSRYELAMQVLGTKLARSLTDTDRQISISGSEPDVVVGDLRSAQKQLRSAAAQLQQITPPAPIRTLHMELIHGVEEYANELDTMIAHVQKGTGPPVSRVLPTLKGVRDMRSASDAITKKGYVIVIDNTP